MKTFLFESLIHHKSMSKHHPCIQCGACCASFRVSFQAKEMESGGLWQVPSPMVVRSGELGTMKGTDEKHRPACMALDGIIGTKVGCKIYSNRPSPCRNFLASYEDGIHRPRCDEARRKHGLRPLGREAYGEHFIVEVLSEKDL